MPNELSFKIDVRVFAYRPDPANPDAPESEDLIYRNLTRRLTEGEMTQALKRMHLWKGARPNLKLQPKDPAAFAKIPAGSLALVVERGDTSGGRLCWVDDAGNFTPLSEAELKEMGAPDLKPGSAGSMIWFDENGNPVSPEEQAANEARRLEEEAAKKIKH